jgi:hypothetical protein
LAGEKHFQAFSQR